MDATEENIDNALDNSDSEKNDTDDDKVRSETVEEKIKENLEPANYKVAQPTIKQHFGKILPKGDS